MTPSIALSSSIPPSAENGVIDAGPSVAHRPYTQLTRRGRLATRAIAWAMQIRCLQAPTHHGPSQRRRRLHSPEEPVGAAATRPVVPYAVRPSWERGGTAQRAVPRESTSLETKGTSL